MLCRNLNNKNQHFKLTYDIDMGELESISDYFDEKENTFISSTFIELISNFWDYYCLPLRVNYLSENSVVVTILYLKFYK